MLLFWLTGALVTTLFGFFLFTQEHPDHAPDMLYAQFAMLLFVSLLLWPLLLLSMIHHITEES